MTAWRTTAPVMWVVDAFSGAGGMLEIAVALAVIAGGVGTLFVGIAALRVAEAWKIWAGRCHPKNPNFRAPSIGRKR